MGGNKELELNLAIPVPESGEVIVRYIFDAPFNTEVLVYGEVQKEHALEALRIARNNETATKLYKLTISEVNPED